MDIHTHTHIYIYIYMHMEIVLGPASWERVTKDQAFLDGARRCRENHPRPSAHPHSNRLLLLCLCITLQSPPVYRAWGSFSARMQACTVGLSPARPKSLGVPPPSRCTADIQVEEVRETVLYEGVSVGGSGKSGYRRRLGLQHQRQAASK